MNEAEKSAIEPEFDRALQLRDKGDWRGAADAFERLDRLHPDQPVILGMWASIYLHLEDWESALLLYQKTVALSPQSELASVGLFHSLWNTGKQSEALTEMRRFLSGCDSKEYPRLMKEMKLEAGWFKI